MKVFILICLMPLALSGSQNGGDFPVMSVPELIKYWGYEVEEHDVTTEDGYILGMHRIPHGKNERQDGSKTKPVAFLAHGLTCNSGVYVFGPPEKSLGYILADAGFDVWMGNTRGNSYSRRHVEFDSCSTCPDFWNFGFDDTGKYDFAAEMDYIMDVTGVDQVHFVGHSMGATQLVVFLSELPEYNDKIAGAYLMGPAVYMTNVNNPITIIASWGETLEILYHFFGFYEFLPHYEFIQWVAHFFCNVEDNPVVGSLCENIVFLFTGINEAQLNMTMMPIYLDNVPDGTSTRPFVHYAQLNLIEDVFQKYDFGSEENMVRYGTETPPIYDLSKVTAPVALFVGDKDDLATVADAETLAANLPNLSLFQIVDFEGFTHMDFAIAIDANKLIYAKILEMMQV